MILDTNNTETGVMRHIIQNIMPTSAAVVTILNGENNTEQKAKEPDTTNNDVLHIAETVAEKELPQLEQEPELESALLNDAPLVQTTISDNYEILMPKSYWETLKAELPDFGLPNTVQPTDFVNFLVTNREIFKVGDVKVKDTVEHNQHLHDTPVAVDEYPKWKLRFALFFMFLGIATAGWFCWRKIQAFRQFRQRLS